MATEEIIIGKTHYKVKTLSNGRKNVYIEGVKGDYYPYFKNVLDFINLGWTALAVYDTTVDIDIYIWNELALKMRQGFRFEENGKFGCMGKDGIILPALFDQIELLHSGDVYIRSGQSVYRFNANGGGQKVRYEATNARFYKDGYVGWMGEGEVIIPAIYDDVSKLWDYDLYETVLNGEVRYFNGEHKEIMTKEKKTLGLAPNEGYPESAYYLRSNENDNLTFIQYCEPNPEDDCIVKGSDGRSVLLTNLNHKEIMDLLTKDCTDLSISDSDLKMFNDNCAYEFSGYIASSRKEDAIMDCIQQFKDFQVNDNTWFYIAKIMTAPGEKISAKELRMFRYYLEDMKPNSLGYVVGVGESKEINSGELKIVLITHYQDGGPCACIRGETLEEVMADEKKHLERISKIKDKKRREEELEEIYLIPFLNIRYSDTQTWQEREQILDYLSERYPRFVNRGHDMLGNLEYCFATDKEEAINRFEFSAAVVRWAASHGVNLNKIYRAETVLDRLYGSLAKSNELGKEWEDERTATIHKLIPELVAMGAKTLAQIREEESATHPKYESEVEKLRLLCESYL